MSLYRFFAGVNPDNPPDARRLVADDARAAMRISALQLAALVCAGASIGFALGAILILVDGF